MLALGAADEAAMRSSVSHAISPAVQRRAPSQKAMTCSGVSAAVMACRRNQDASMASSFGCSSYTDKTPGVRPHAGTARSCQQP